MAVRDGKKAAPIGVRSTHKPCQKLSAPTSCHSLHHLQSASHPCEPNASYTPFIASDLHTMRNHTFSHLWQTDQTNCLRGIATLFIVIGHILIEWNAHRVVNITGAIGVAMFLFMSGYGMHESYKVSGLKHFWRKRFLRIILPYWIFITVLAPFKADFTLHDYLLDIAFINSSYWFIAYLVRCYLLYWLIQRFVPSRLLTLYFIGGILTLNLCQQLEAQQAFSFMAGVLASCHIERLRHTEGRRLLWASGICFLIAFAFLMLKEIPAVHAYKGSLIYHYILVMIMLPICMPLLLVPSVFPILVRSRLLYFCGICSFEIYLVHMALLPMIEEPDLLRAVAYLAATILLTWLFYKFNQQLKRWGGLLQSR